MIHEDFLVVLAQSVHLLSFEARKDTQAIFSYVLRFRDPNSTAEESRALTYVINEKPEIVVELCRGYAHKESATPCGAILRDILRHEHIATILLFDESRGTKPATKIDEIDVTTPQSGEGVFWNFFEWIDRGSFEVSADAFTTFKVRQTACVPTTSRL